MSDAERDLTQMLTEADPANREDLARQLFPAVYDELRALAAQFFRNERLAHTLQPTALVHEAYLKLVDQSRVNWQGKTHFYAVGAQAMRRILIDYARSRSREKRGGGWHRVALSGVDFGKDDELIDMEGLEPVLVELADLDPRQAQIVELRFFAGMTVEDVANFLGVSKRKVEGDWTHAKAWLRSKLTPDEDA